MTSPNMSRLVRRETHSPRTAAAYVAVIITIVALLYAGTEIVLHSMGQPAILWSPAQAFSWLIDLPHDLGSGAIAGASILMLVGIVFLVLGVAPGRLPRHSMRLGDRAVVVDNSVIASSLSRHLAAETGLRADDVLVGVSHRTADITAVADRTTPVQAADLEAAAVAELSSYDLSRPLRVRVRVRQPTKKDLER